MTAAGEDAEPHRQLLDHVQDRHQQSLKQQQPITPLHTALPGGDHAAHVGIGQHHDQARTEDGEGPGQSRANQWL